MRKRAGNEKGDGKESGRTIGTHETGGWGTNKSCDRVGPEPSGTGTVLNGTKLVSGDRKVGPDGCRPQGQNQRARREFSPTGRPLGDRNLVLGITQCNKGRRREDGLLSG